VAEWKYINQQEQQIDGVADLVNKETNDPQKRARQIFVERLKARREKSQKLAEERKENTFYI